MLSHIKKKERKWHCWRKGSTTIIRISGYWAGNQSVMHKEGFKRKSKRKEEKEKGKKDDIVGEMGHSNNW